jgi:hypothetical protein
MIVSAWKAFWRQFGFYKEPSRLTEREKDAYRAQWHDAEWFYGNPQTIVRVTDGTPVQNPYAAGMVAAKNQRLAQIARERAWVYANKDELLAKRKGFYVRLRALKNAEMAVEQGKPEPGK